MKFEVFTAVEVCMLIFHVNTPCNIGGIDQRFGGTYCFLLHGTLNILTFYIFGRETYPVRISAGLPAILVLYKRTLVEYLQIYQDHAL
jgi:hypothetical protein